MTFGLPLIFLVDIKIGLKTFGETASMLIFQNMALLILSNNSNYIHYYILSLQELYWVLTSNNACFS